MKYFSTRNTKIEKNFSEIIMQGLAKDGGLYMPSEWPKVDINNLKEFDYSDLAFEVISPYCNDSIPQEELRKIINNTYKIFHHPKVAPVIDITNNKHILELFYGPTFAFKDYALQFIANLFEYFINKESTNLTIIGATSGDTGSAAIEACKLKKNINVFILHPYEKISDVQRRQMTTIIEPNIYNIAIKGNFDDCQNIIKNLFMNEDLLSKTKLSTINSINWARIIAQSVYYYWAVLHLKGGMNKIDFIVPTGNFGNVFAGMVAKKMGLPINKLHVVSNSNDILHRTVSKGDMSIQKVVKTLSPSMDIQISSNFERQLFDSLKFESKRLPEIMRKFSIDGKYQLEQTIIDNLSEHYDSYVVDDKKILNTINLFYKKYHYISDPHTATALSILDKMNDENSHFISLACAHPSKFENAIIDSIGIKPDFPDSLKNIFDKEEKFTILENDKTVIKEYILNKI